MLVIHWPLCASIGRPAGRPWCPAANRVRAASGAQRPPAAQGARARPFGADWIKFAGSFLIHVRGALAATVSRHSNSISIPLYCCRLRLRWSAGSGATHFQSDGIFALLLFLLSNLFCLPWSERRNGGGNCHRQARCCPSGAVAARAAAEQNGGGNSRAHLTLLWALASH